MENIELLEQQAIDAAINGAWEKAIESNEHILKADEENIDAHLRLGYAYLQANNLKEAQKQYKKALKIQPKNNIAIEHLEKIEVLDSKKKTKSSTSVKYDPNLFLEVPGKTKTIQLVNLGKKEDLAGRTVGEEMMLKEKKRRLEVRTLHNEYIGTLPDDISKRLLYFMKENSEYNIYIKEIDLTEVIVFIREIEKGKKVKQYPSFPSNPHVMLTDINQLEEEEETITNEEDNLDEDDDTTEKSDEDEDEIDIEDEQWGDYEDEDKESLDHYVEVEEEEEEE
ncbi:MAG TPA: tetratricopeptide repeat protein [Candidatus Woesebacteria bacterium]|nr:tetratricopeptide repeat protein [Candidatus Woesebacteria bacterium]